MYRCTAVLYSIGIEYGPHRTVGQATLRSNVSELGDPYIVRVPKVYDCFITLGFFSVPYVRGVGYERSWSEGDMCSASLTAEPPADDEADDTFSFFSWRSC